MFNEKPTQYMNNYGKNQFVFSYKSADFGGAVRCRCQYYVLLLYDLDDGSVHRKQTFICFYPYWFLYCVGVWLNVYVLHTCWIMQQYKIDNFLKDTQQFQFLDPVIWFKNVMLHSDLFIYLFTLLHFIKRCSVLIYFKSKIWMWHYGCNKSCQTTLRV